MQIIYIPAQHCFLRSVNWLILGTASENAEDEACFSEDESEAEVLGSPPRAKCLCGNTLGMSPLGAGVTFHSGWGVLLLPRCQ